MRKFIFYNLFSDDSYYYEGIEAYLVSIVNVTIKNRSEFKKSEIFIFEIFKLHVSNLDCNNSMNTYWQHLLVCIF